MIEQKSVLAIVPARSNSKGLPGKNIKFLCGKPLIAWSIAAGLESRYVDEVMVSTDGNEIADIAKKHGAKVPFLRPSELAGDTSSTFDAVKHVIDEYRNRFDRTFDYIVLLEPTSPLRAKTDIDAMLERLATLSDEFDAIVSLGPVHEHPSIMKKVVANDIEPYYGELKMTTRRQDNDAAYFPYGVAYVVKTSTLLEEKTFYPKRTTHHFVQRYQCYEIDDIYDFLAVENIMKHEWNLT